jgi:hypothetical protein
MSIYRVKLDDDLELAQFVESDADELFELTDRNRAHLREWLGWLDTTKSPADRYPLQRQVNRRYRFALSGLGTQANRGWLLAG